MIKWKVIQTIYSLLKSSQFNKIKNQNNVIKRNNIKVLREVLKGSGLGRILWNILYDDVLNINFQVVHTVAYADCFAKSNNEVVISVNLEKSALDLNWIIWQLHQKKTEAIILAGRKMLGILYLI